MSRREGVSGVVATALIILLVVSAIAVVQYMRSEAVRDIVEYSEMNPRAVLSSTGVSPTETGYQLEIVNLGNGETLITSFLPPHGSAVSSYVGVGVGEAKKIDVQDETPPRNGIITTSEGPKVVGVLQGSSLIAVNIYTPPDSEGDMDVSSITVSIRIAGEDGFYKSIPLSLAEPCPVGDAQPTDTVCYVEDGTGRLYRVLFEVPGGNVYEVVVQGSVDIYYVGRPFFSTTEPQTLFVQKDVGVPVYRSYVVAPLTGETVSIEVDIDNIIVKTFPDMPPTDDVLQVPYILDFQDIFEAHNLGLGNVDTVNMTDYVLRLVSTGLIQISPASCPFVEIGEYEGEIQVGGYPIHTGLEIRVDTSACSVGAEDPLFTVSFPVRLGEGLYTFIPVVATEELNIMWTSILTQDGDILAQEEFRGTPGSAFPPAPDVQQFSSPIPVSVGARDNYIVSLTFALGDANTFTTPRAIISRLMFIPVPDASTVCVYTSEEPGILPFAEIDVSSCNGKVGRDSLRAGLQWTELLLPSPPPLVKHVAKSYRGGSTTGSPIIIGDTYSAPQPLSGEGYSYALYYDGVRMTADFMVTDPTTDSSSWINLYVSASTWGPVFGAFGLSVVNNMFTSDPVDGELVLRFEEVEVGGKILVYLQPTDVPDVGISVSGGSLIHPSTSRVHTGYIVILASSPTVTVRISGDGLNWGVEVKQVAVVDELPDALIPTIHTGNNNLWTAGVGDTPIGTILSNVEPYDPDGYVTIYVQLLPAGRTILKLSIPASELLHDGRGRVAIPIDYYTTWAYNPFLMEYVEAYRGTNLYRIVVVGAVCPAPTES